MQNVLLKYKVRQFSGIEAPNRLIMQCPQKLIRSGPQMKVKSRRIVSGFFG